MGSGRTTTLDSGIPQTVARQARRRDRLRSMKSRTVPRILTFVAVLTIVVAAVGFVVTLILNAFVLDEYDAYGEVPIPGVLSAEPRRRPATRGGATRPCPRGIGPGTG